MKQWVLVILSTLTIAGVTAQNVDYDQLLEILDERSSFIGEDFSAQMTMISEDPEDGIERNVIRMFRRDAEDNFVIIFEEPDTKRGEGYLNVEENLWLYDPESRKFIHTSMKESFENTDARNSDFQRSSYSEDYLVTNAEESTLGRFDVWVLDLEAIHDEVTYPFKKIWLTMDTNLILKTEDYSLGQRLLRTSLYPGWSKVGDSYTPNRMIFIDELIEGRKTQITLAEISTASIPDSVFTKAYLQNVNR